MIGQKKIPYWNGLKVQFQQNHQKMAVAVAEEC